MKKRMAYFCMAVFVLLCCMPGSRVLASGQTAEELPQIIRWENGNGLDKDGNLIKNGWAYDTVNPAGRYVLFGENGEVLRKQETWQEDGEESTALEDYTATNMNLGKIGFRCKGFEAFAGTVTITIRETSGRTATCVLSPETDYSANVEMAVGSYCVELVSACQEETYYQVETPADPILVGEGQFVFVNLTVTQNVIERAAEVEETAAEETAADAAYTEESKNQEGSEVKQEMKEKSRSPLFLFGAVLAAGILGCAIYKKKRNQYE